ncbi:TIGR02270 family protein [Vitiosangium sp. GDMCC 1.1324]|uniref:TIGR02270 family protein n=1 Tax=Vitiosangium sp. (strain GDMCC 1.1324) TaxID=2138576 RepID=UPI000D3735C4|nr:TIGR02270 family protein [Vitiosangium sp. GDMCC 1.1324]PTL77834.1 hypothetical protein DAT35_42290 [Vitiosangium sp. GDMCC 1.1324]
MSRVMMDICEEHLDEASFLWTQWERALVAPDYDLSDTAELEERLLAHLDGLVEGGNPVAEALLRPSLESEEVTRVSSAAFALLASAGMEKCQALLRDASPDQRTSIQRALELCAGRELGESLLPLLKADDPDLLATVLEVLVVREEASDTMLADFLTHENARIRTAALKGLRALPRSNPRNLLSQALTSPIPALRDAAIEAGLVAGVRDAWTVCRKVLAARDDHGREPMVLWAMGCEEKEVELLVELLQEPRLRANALWALGFSGWAVAADACLAWLADDAVARLAGEAFSAITGLRLEDQYVLPEQEPPEEPIPLEQEDLDANLVPRAEDALPRPNPEAITEWWREARGRFERRTRYLMGYPFHSEVLMTALERGSMRRRHVHARELAIRSRRTCHVPTRLLTRQQRAGLERAKGASTRTSAFPFARLLSV